MVVGAEASVAVVAVGHKMEAEPVFVADDRRWDIAARQPERETKTVRLFTRCQLETKNRQKHVSGALCSYARLAT